ncbi:MAG: adenylate/guanylate cyclase domain-containing protein [Candidatus Kariarchaeaceae archaeon]
MKLRSKKTQQRLLLLVFLFSLSISLIIYIFDVQWNKYDYRFLDELYKTSISNGSGPSSSKRIILLSITDETYQILGSNFVDRKYLAEVINTLQKFDPEFVAYDIIFANPSNSLDDSIFSSSLSKLREVYLPTGLKLSNSIKNFYWRNRSNNNLIDRCTKLPIIKAIAGNPFYSEWAISSIDQIENAVDGTGHISVIRDSDGVIRHHPMLVKIDSLYLPTISLAIYLKYMNISLEDVKIYWGEKLVIPKTEKSFNETEIIIPIDESVNTFIPYTNTWDKVKLTKISIQDFLKFSKDLSNYDELLNMIEGNFIFIHDISTGAADLGETPIEHDSPLILMHTSLLSALLNNNFFEYFNPLTFALLIFISGLLIAIIIMIRLNLLLYIYGIAIPLLLVLFSYYQITSANLFPLFSALVSFLIIFLSTVISLQVISIKEKKFIRHAFTKYVSPSVVDELIENESKLILSGEEREVSILFSDIKGFTTLAEKMNTHDLVRLLNDYLTEMSDVILENKGTIDKFIGDAILAEFGAPISLEAHADLAVSTGLQMLKKLSDFNKTRASADTPDISCRIGINTGNVIIGNMGSKDVFDYTVIGDPVNLAARLESANKIYGTKLIVSEQTFKLLDKDKFQYRILDSVKVQGKSKGVKIYNIYAFKDDQISELVTLYYQDYREGMENYYLKNFELSKNLFEKALENKPDDEASILLLKRLETLDISNLAEQWDGTYTLTEK